MLKERFPEARLEGDMSTEEASTSQLSLGNTFFSNCGRNVNRCVHSNIRQRRSLTIFPNQNNTADISQRINSTIKSTAPAVQATPPSRSPKTISVARIESNSKNSDPSKTEKPRGPLKMRFFLLLW